MNHSNKFTLYIDESGAASLTDLRSRYFLLTGLVVQNTEDSELSGYFDFLKRKYGLSRFHSFDIFENKSSVDYLTNAKATEFSTSLAEFINVVPAEFMVAAIDKKEIVKFFDIGQDFLTEKTLNNTEIGREVRDIAYDILASKLFFWFAKKFLESEKFLLKGSIVAESRSASDHSLLTAFLDCKEPDKYRNNRSELVDYSKLMRERITGIKFENKIAECAGLEIADLLSYVSFISLNRRGTEFEQRGIPKMNRVIRIKIAESGIQLVPPDHIPYYLPVGRVHRISKYCQENYSDSL